MKVTRSQKRSITEFKKGNVLKIKVKEKPNSTIDIVKHLKPFENKGWRLKKMNCDFTSGTLNANFIKH